MSRFVYLGSVITDDGYTLEDVKTRIATAKKKFIEKRDILSSEIDINIRKRITKAVWSTATYGAETWTMSKEIERRLQSFEMWCWRRLLKVKWTEKKTKERVLDEIGEERKLLSSIKKRKHCWIGHVLRHEGMLKEVMEGRMEGKRGRVRRRLGC